MFACVTSLLKQFLFAMNNAGEDDAPTGNGDDDLLVNEAEEETPDDLLGDDGHYDPVVVATLTDSLRNGRLSLNESATSMHNDSAKKEVPSRASQSTKRSASTGVGRKRKDTSEDVVKEKPKKARRSRTSIDELGEIAGFYDPKRKRCATEQDLRKLYAKDGDKKHDFFDINTTIRRPLNTKKNDPLDNSHVADCSVQELTDYLEMVEYAKVTNRQRTPRKQQFSRNRNSSTTSSSSISSVDTRPRSETPPQSPHDTSNETISNSDCNSSSPSTASEGNANLAESIDVNSMIINRITTPIRATTPALTNRPKARIVLPKNPERDRSTILSDSFL